ncbi:lipid II:glycine glycyltransferase FemX [Candidatus Altiarchaeota archaeon]
MDLRLEVIDESKKEFWNQLVQNCSHGTVFHTWDWIHIINKHTWTSLLGWKVKSKLYPVIIYSGDQAIGLCPLFKYNFPFFTITLSPPSRTETPYLGPLIKDFDTLTQYKREQLYEKFFEMLERFMDKDLKADYSFFRMSPNLADGRPLMWSDYHVSPLYTYDIDLSPSLEEIRAGFKKSLRKNISKMEKELVVEDGGREELLLIYEAVIKRFEEQDVNTRFLKEFLLDVFDRFYPDNLKITVARKDGNFVGGVISTVFRDRVEAWIGTAKPNMPGVYPSDLLHWKLIEWAKENDYKTYEIVWANTQRLNQFKSKYNPSLTIYLNAYKYRNLRTRLLMAFYYRILKKLKYSFEWRR